MSNAVGILKACVVAFLTNPECLFQLLVFSVMPLKIDQTENKNRSIDKSQESKKKRR